MTTRDITAAEFNDTINDNDIPPEHCDPPSGEGEGEGEGE